MTIGSKELLSVPKVGELVEECGSDLELDVDFETVENSREEMLVEEFVVDGREIRGTLGWEPVEAVEQTVEAYLRRV